MDSDSSAATRRPCFIEEDDGLASLADMEAGFSGNSNTVHNNKQNHRYFCSRSSGFARRSSLRSMSSSTSMSSYGLSSPRSVRFYEARFEEHQPHFLEACFLCKKPLGDNRDIFMYRGDTPFCSEECREEQIEIDEAKEKNWNLSSAMKALRSKDQRKSTSPTKPQDYSSHTSTVAAA